MICRNRWRSVPRNFGKFYSLMAFRRMHYSICRGVATSSSSMMPRTSLHLRMRALAPPSPAREPPSDSSRSGVRGERLSPPSLAVRGSSPTGSTVTSGSSVWPPLRTSGLVLPLSAGTSCFSPASPSNRLAPSDSYCSLVLVLSLAFSLAAAARARAWSSTARSYCSTSSSACFLLSLRWSLVPETARR